MTPFDGRVAIITGGSRGIGKALALELASQGAAVVVAAKTMESNGRLPGSVPETVREIEARGGKALGVRCDVRDDADLKNLVDRALERFGRIDILVNNAGAMWLQAVEGTPQKRFDLMLDINSRAPFLLAHHCIPHMRQQKWGHIVTMSPPIGLEVLEHVGGKVAYMASKLNATLLTLGLAQELAGQGIACNSVWTQTLIGTAATQNLGIGAPEDWRSEDIVVDATMAVLEQDPEKLCGSTLLDAEILRRFKGIEDLSRYRFVPDREPTAMTWARWDLLAEQAREKYFAAMMAADAAKASKSAKDA
ncbi:SDR family oxidoreductase [Kibdelosporangium aridum]|uniref:Short chain dehydrogenase n=1 Tax=Kibdelosporangium aridum TaxID=2030 RepID=A0A1W2FVL8_KIBAR|nr:SDR family oxidoreductase [Kibdelosporangium aridum]SMD25844.1 short chain dehydrogenase [Kibdelosporangium aridum]